MASGKTVDSVWIDVLPSLASFGPALRAGLAATSKDAAAMGALGGDAYGKAFGDSAVTAVEKASAKVSAAQKKLADAQGAVTVKQAQLNDLVNSGTASTTKLAAAQEALAKAERNVELQTARSSAAQEKYAAAQQGLVTAQQRLAAAQQKVNDLANSSTASTKAQAAAQKELAAAQAQVEAATGRVASTELGMQRTAKALADAQGAAVVAQQRLNDVRSSGSATTAQVAAAEEQLARAQRDVTVQSEAVAAAQAQQQRAMEAQTAAEAAAERGAVTFKDALAGVRAEGGLLTSGFGLLNKAMTTAFGIGIVAMPIDKLIKSTADYQSALTRLVTTAGESVSNIKAVGQGMLDMAGQVGISAGDLAQGMYVVESSMPPTISGTKRAADALTILKAAAQGARQENAALPDVVNAVTTALHDYGKPASDAATITSEMVTAVSHGKTTFEDLTASLHTITPLAASLKVPFADIIGSLAAMTASGESADQATQNMASTLTHLAKPTQPMIQELAQLGITARQFSQDLSSKGLAGTVQEISDAIIQHMGPSGQVVLDTMNKSKLAAESLKTMLGSMPPTLSKLSQGLLDGSVSYKAYRKAVQDMGGQASSMGQQFLSLVKTQDGFSNALKSGNSSVQNYTQALAASLGGQESMAVGLQLTGVSMDGTVDKAKNVNAIIADVARASGDASGNIKGWGEVQATFNQQMSEAIHQLGAMWIELGQHLLPALTAAAGFLNRDVLPAIKSFAGYVGDAWHAVSQWASAHKTLMQGLGVGLGTFAAIALGFKTITTVAGVAEAGVKLFGKAIGGAFSGSTVGIVVAAVAAIAAGMDFAYQHSKTLQQGVYDLVVGFENGKASVGDSGFTAVLENVGAAARHVWDYLQQLGQVIRADAIGALHGLTKGAQDLWGAISGIVPAFEGFYKSVGQYLVTAFGNLKAIAPTLLDALKNIGETVGGILLTGLKDAGVIIGGLVVAGGKLVQWSLDLATGLANLGSAITSHAQGPLGILADVLDGLTKVLSVVPSQITLVAAAIATLKLTGLWDSLVLKGMYAVDTMKGVFSALVFSAKAAATGVGESMAGMRTAFAVGQFEQAIQGAGRVKQAIGGMAAVGTSAVQGLGSAIGGVAKAAFGGLKSAATGLMNLFGGPWGIAIIGVTAGIWALTAAQQAHAEQVKQDTQNMQGWLSAIAATPQDAAAAEEAMQKVLDKKKELAVDTGELKALQNLAAGTTDGAQLFGKAIDDMKGHIKDLTGEYKNAYDALDPLQQKQVDLYIAIQQYGQTSPQAAVAAQKLNDQQQKLAKLANEATYAIEGENGQVRQSMDLQLQSIDATLGAQQATLDARSAIEQYASTLKDSNATDLEKQQAQNSMAEAISQAVQQTEQAVIKNEQSIDPQRRSADAVAAARDVFNQLTKEIGGVPPALQGLDDKLNGGTTTALENAQTNLSNTQDQINTTEVKLGDLGGAFDHLANNDVAQVAIPGLQNLQKEMNGPTVSALTNGQSAAGNLGQAFVNTNGQVTTVFIPGLMQMQGQLNGPTVQALLNTLANTDNAKDAIGYLTTAVKTMPPGTTIDIGADTTAATNSIDTLITSYGKVTYTGSSIIVNGRVIANADGNLLTSGMTPMSASVAQVVQPGTLRVIGDNPVAPEAFIPLNDSARSHMILGAAASQMGYGLVPMSAGGVVTQGPIASPVHWPAWLAPHETFPARWQPGFLASIAQDMVALQNAAAAMAGVPASRAANEAAVQAVAATYGWGQGAQWADLVNVIMRESGFNNVAQNPTSTAYGMFQFLDSTWGSYGPKTSDPSLQAQYGLRYIRDRYINPAGAWAHELSAGWYDTGGQVGPGWHMVFNGTGEREVMLNPPQIDNLNKLLSAPVDHFYSNSVEHHRSQHTTQQAPLIGNVDITMAQADPNEVMNTLFHRLEVAQRGGVYAMNPAYSG